MAKILRFNGGTPQEAAEADPDPLPTSTIRTAAGHRAEALLQDAALLAEEYDLSREEALQLVLRFLDGNGSAAWPQSPG